MIIATLHANAAKAKALVGRVVPLLAAHSGPCPQGCRHTLDHALITAPERRDPALVTRLDAVAGRVLRSISVEPTK
jgi:5'-methylthioadenosine phosphorylase